MRIEFEEFYSTEQRKLKKAAMALPENHNAEFQYGFSFGLPYPCPVDAKSTGRIVNLLHIRRP